jgi:hypothetical protein
MPAVADETTFSVNHFGKGIVNNNCNHCLSPLYFYDKSTHLSDKGPKMLPDGPRADPECKSGFKGKRATNKFGRYTKGQVIEN